MANTDVWDRAAARRSGNAADISAVTYAPDVPGEPELRLCGDVKGKRLLDLGCGSGENAIVFSKQGAHVVAVDRSAAQLALGRKYADAAKARVEWHEGDVADLAFLRADSIDLALAASVLSEIEDVDRLLRQVHRVLRPGAPFVFSMVHPMALAVGREGAAPGALPLGSLEVRRAYFDDEPVDIVHDDETIRVFPRTIATIFSSLHRAGYRVDVLLEPAPVASAGRDTGGPDRRDVARPQRRRVARSVPVALPAPQPTGEQEERTDERDRRDRGRERPRDECRDGPVAAAVRHDAVEWCRRLAHRLHGVPLPAVDARAFAG